MFSWLPFLYFSEFVRLKKEVDEDRKNQLRENVKKSTVELLLKMTSILEKSGGEFIVGNRVRMFMYDLPLHRSFWNRWVYKR